MLSFLDCPHRRVQDFTECCLDCGYNMYTTKEEYLKDLQQQLEAKGIDQLTMDIRKAEALLK